MSDPSAKKSNPIIMLLILSTVPLTLGIAFYVFALSAKSTDAYQCGIETARQNDFVTGALGAPLEPGPLAWTHHYESAGSRSEGRISTSISGPDGSGTLTIDFFRTPASSSFQMIFDFGDESLVVHKGSWPCMR